MKVAGTLMLACIILGIFQSVAAALAVALILMLVWGAIFRPRETYGFLAFGLVMQLLEHHAGLCVAVAGVIVAAALIADRPSPP